jgi:hypothetical protein
VELPAVRGRAHCVHFIPLDLRKIWSKASHLPFWCLRHYWRRPPGWDRQLRNALCCKSHHWFCNRFHCKWKYIACAQLCQGDLPRSDLCLVRSAHTEIQKTIEILISLCCCRNDIHSQLMLENSCAVCLYTKPKSHLHIAVA